MRVGMGIFYCPEGDREDPKGGTYVVARYDEAQMLGMPAWRPSKSNPFGESGVTDHGGST